MWAAQSVAGGNTACGHSGLAQRWSAQKRRGAAARREQPDDAQDGASSVHLLASLFTSPVDEHEQKKQAR